MGFLAVIIDQRPYEIFHATVGDLRVYTPFVLGLLRRPSAQYDSFVQILLDVQFKPDVCEQ